MFFQRMRRGLGVLTAAIAGLLAGAASAGEPPFDPHPGQIPYWGDYVAPSGRIITIGRSLSDPAAMFVYDSRSHRFATLAASGDGYCAEACAVRVRFHTAAQGVSGLVFRKGRDVVVARHSPLQVEDVTFVRDGVTFKGRLWKGRGAAVRPAVVLIGGTGKNTRDDFRVYPYLFVRHGFAVLAFDKRGSGESGGGGPVEEEGIATLAEDNAAAVSLLRSRPDIDPNRIGALGISHGAWVVDEMAARDPKLAFIVPVVGGGAPLWRATEFDMVAHLGEKHFPPAEIAEADRFLLEVFRLAREHPDQIKPLVEANKAKPWFGETPIAPFAGLPAEVMGPVAASAWKTELSYDPAPRLALSAAPVFAIVAEKDDHVPALENAEAIRRAAGPRATILMLKGANHRQALDDGPTMTFAPELFDRLGAWLEQRRTARIAPR